MSEPYPFLKSLPSIRLVDMSSAMFEARFIGHYYPTRLQDLSQREESRRLLELKKNDLGGVTYWARRVREAFGNSSQRVLAIAMPSHSVGPAQPNVKLRRLFTLITSITDLSDCLVRQTAVIQSHKAKPGSRPTAKTHLDSLAIASREKLADRDILLIDDVLTRGASMQAARAKLLYGGARTVSCLALTRTMNQAPPPVTEDDIPF